MKLSVITVNLNNRDGLQRTIDSVVSQTYADFEYIVIDGGSTDGSLDVITSSRDKITRMISEKDNGVYEAMNKAIGIANGEYLQFLNSGDCLVENTTLEKVFFNAPAVDIIYGNMKVKDGDQVSDGIMPALIDVQQLVRDTLWHPVSFIKKALFVKYGNYDTSYRIAADYDFFFKVIVKHHCSTFYIQQFIALFELGGLSSHPANVNALALEREKIQKTYLSKLEFTTLNQASSKREPFFKHLFQKWFR